MQATRLHLCAMEMTDYRAAILTGFLMGAGLATSLPGQTFHVLHSFNGTDGAQVEAGLVISNETLYGTTKVGGAHNWGTIYSVNAGGANFTTLYNFYGLYSGTGTDGGTPVGSLVVASAVLYGTASQGGVGTSGTVFAMTTTGLGTNDIMSALHAFSSPSSTYPLWINSEGAAPAANLILSGATLYGTTSTGGANGNGTVFSVGTNGTNFKVLHTFAATGGPLAGNVDGANPVAGLTLADGVLYGTASAGGGNGMGVVYSLGTNGTDFKVLHTFAATNSAGANLDGRSPEAPLILAGSRLYGTAFYGGTDGLGTVFSLNTNGGGFTVLRTFTIADHNNGADPPSGLLLAAGRLYGTTLYGGTNGYGNIFVMSIDGSSFTNLYSFSGGKDGSFPYGTLIMSSNTLYGTAYGGGENGDYGVVFSLQLASAAASTITDIMHNADGSVTLNGLSSPGSSNRVLATTNLAAPVFWQTLSTNTAGVTGAWRFTDSQVGSYRLRFYRAVSP